MTESEFKLESEPESGIRSGPTLFASIARRAEAVKVLQGCGRDDFAFDSCWVGGWAWLKTDRGGLREGYMSS